MIFQDRRTTKAAFESLESFKKSVIDFSVRLTKNSIFIFTCGARPNNNETGRELLMDYAANNLEQFNFFKAEKIFKVLGEKGGGKDWLTIEKKLAEYSDCVVIVLESQSTFSELGAFMLEDELAESVLVINDLKFRDSKSFISLGPLAKLERVSEFKPVIHTKFKNFGRCFGELEKRLEKLKRGKDKRVSLRDYKEFNEIPSKERLLFVLDLIAILTPVKKVEILKMLKFIYGEDKSYDEIYLLIPLLVALDLIRVEKGYLVRTLQEFRLYYSFTGIDINRFRSNILNNYFKNSRERFELLSSRLQ